MYCGLRSYLKSEGLDYEVLLSELIEAEKAEKTERRKQKAAIRAAKSAERRGRILAEAADTE